MKKAILFGIGASFFFAFTFILNRQMNLNGGSWIWSASLRYIFTLPFFYAILILKNDFTNVIQDIKQRPMAWLIWSTVGFGLFYAPLTLASVYGASWIVAGTWQITIIAGSLLSPLFYKIVETEYGTFKMRDPIPKKSLLMSSIILLGIFMVQFQQAQSLPIIKTLVGVFPVIIAAFAYPLGNRKMMEICNNRLNTIQRIFGMTLSSMPFWIALSVYGILKVGLPSRAQVLQSSIVAISSGVIATILFFKATNIVRNDPHKLAVVETTQSGEVIFTLLGSIIVLHDQTPTIASIAGILFIVLGIILNSITTNNTHYPYHFTDDRAQSLN